MKDKEIASTSNVELVSTWLDDAGGKILLGATTLKSVKLSKNREKLTLVIKKKSRKENDQDPPSA